MEKEEIADQGDQGPGFLGVPVPEAAPGVVGPDSAENRSRREEKDADLKGLVEVSVESLRRIPTRDDASKDDMGHSKGQSKGGIAQRDREDMSGEPEIVAQDRGEGMDRPIKDHRLAIGQDQRRHGNGNGSEQEGASAVDGLEDQGEEDGSEGHPDHRLVHVGDRRTSGDQHAGEKSRRLQQEPAAGKNPGQLIGSFFPASPRDQQKDPCGGVKDPGPAEGVGFLVGNLKADLPIGG